MKKHITRVIGIILLFLVGLCLVGCGGGSDDGMSQDEWHAMVKLGMTDAEVIAVVGRPPETVMNTNSGTEIGWRFGNDVGRVIYDANHIVVLVRYISGMYG